MKKVYNIEFTQNHGDFKKGDKTSKFSRDISNIFVNTLKVAKFVSDKPKKEVKKSKPKK